MILLFYFLTRYEIKKGTHRRVEQTVSRATVAEATAEYFSSCDIYILFFLCIEISQEIMHAAHQTQCC